MNGIFDTIMDGINRDMFLSTSYSSMIVDAILLRRIFRRFGRCRQMLWTRIPDVKNTDCGHDGHELWT